LSRPRPPRVFGWLLRRCLPATPVGEAIDGDLREEHARLCRDRGERSAAAWYRREATSVGLSAVAIRLRAVWRGRERAQARRGESLRQLLSEALYALRGFVARPLFAATVVLTLALAIAVNTAIFTLVNAVLLRPLPVKEPERLLEVFTTGDSALAQSTSSWADFVDLRRQATSFEGLVAHSLMMASLAGEGGGSELVIGELVSADYFDVLGVRPVRGRAFLPEEDRSEGSHPVAVLGYAMWRDRFHGSDDVLGATLRLNGTTFTVIGVAPEGFAGTTAALVPALWIPTMMAGSVEPVGLNDTTASESGRTRIERRGWRWLWVTGRLAPGVSAEQARAELQTISARLQAEHPISNRERRFAVVPRSDVRIHPVIDGAMRPAAAFLLSAVGLVLLIACANVAGVVLARTAGRRRELAIRFALGASRLRVVRLLLVESVLLSLAGGGLGLLLGVQGTRLLAQLRPPLPMAVSFDITPDLRVALFAFGLSLATGLVFGLAPALRSARADLVPDLKTGGPGAGSRRFGMRSALVVAQVAVSLVLLVGAALATRGLFAARGTDTGFDTGRLAHVGLDMGMHGYAGDDAIPFYDELLRRARSLPGVEAAALTNQLPFTLNWRQNEFYPGVRDDFDTPGQLLGTAAVGAGYFETMGIPVLEGRAPDERDTAEAPRRVAVSAALARRLWAGESAVGKRLTQRHVGVLEVVGVVGDHRMRELGGPFPEVVFFPIAQRWHSAALVVVRSREPAKALEELRGAVFALEPDATFLESRTMDAQLAVPLFSVRASATLLGSLGVFGLLLASVGLYGVAAQQVAARTREIGTRMALGARRGDVLRLVVGDGMRLVGWGALIGGVAAALLSQVVRSLLYGVSPLDPIAFGVGLAVLASVALAAHAVPARRAATVDPLTALRDE